MIIPFDQLDPQTLDRVIEDFVTRDGTEATDAHVKIQQVRKALSAGRAVITFDEETQTVSISPVDRPNRDDKSSTA